MEPILSKHEISDLLKAIKQGRVSLDLEKEKDKHPVKNCSPLNIFQINVFRDELSRLPNFDIILDGFCQNYAMTLTNQLQRTFSITRTGLDVSHFIDFLLENKDVGAIGVLEVSPLKHGALILIDKHMCFNLIEIMLGASPDIDPLQPDRKLTAIELNIIKALLNHGCEDLDRAFAPLIALQSSLIKVESNSRLVSITEPDAEILVGSFQINIGEATGSIKLAFPLATLDPLKENLKDLLNVNKAKKGLWTDILEAEIQDITAEIIAQSGVITMSVNKVLSLKKGDTILLDYNPNKPLQVLVENQIKFHAIPGTHNGKKAINITGVHNSGA